MHQDSCTISVPPASDKDYLFMYLFVIKYHVTVGQQVNITPPQDEKVARLNP